LIYILNIETATKNCSVSLGKNGQLIDVIEYAGEGYSHAEKLHLFIDEILKKNKLNTTSLNAVAVSMGPGSYTGLRIGVSAAKGLAYALDLPLIAIPTLEILARAITEQNAFVIPIIDARRMEVYSAVFNQHEKIRATKAEILNETSFSEYLNQKKTIFIGDAVDKTGNIVQHENAIYSDIRFPSAKEMSALSWNRYEKGEFEDVAYFEPFYLKDFISTKKKSI